jgi:ribose transport system ATP-binding protein
MSDRRVESCESAPLLQARGICKYFPGVRALDNVDFTVQRGSLNALLGENGAGKSTLMHILSGGMSSDEGQILLDGEPVKFRSPREAQDAGVAIIHQELNLVPDLSVAENIFLGREPRNRLRLIDYRKMTADARRLLAMLDPSIDPGLVVGRLRVGAQQIVEIAKALSFDARVIIMDEPTSAISEQEIESLFRLIQTLKHRGVGIVYITHKLKELDRSADEITVMRDGRLIASKAFRDVSHDEMIRLMVGRELTERFPKTAVSSLAEVLRVEGVSLQHAERIGEYVLRGVSFVVRSGEVVGLFGLMGAGRSELLQTIFGLHPGRSTGTVAVAGKQVRIRSPRDAIRAGIAMAPEDRKAEGLVLSMSVVENSSLSCLQRVTTFGFVRPVRERNLVSEFVRRMAIKTRSLSERVRNLSGGNQQKVVLAKWLATEPAVLLLDEPTRGIDVNAKREIYALIDELARGGMGIVVVSSEMPEILTIADRILVLAEGRVSAEFDRNVATEEKILAAALPRERSQPAPLVGSP